MLTKGDAIGGQARNLAGCLGDWKFFRKFIAVLKLAGLTYRFKDSNSGLWADEPELDAGVEKRIKAIHWQQDNKDRLLIKNTKVPLIDKNVDLILIEGTSADYAGAQRSLLSINNRYLALGELKGGIDPAGSDEHWKPANLALNRIRSSFGSLGLNPPTFFIGAAIEANMADEVVRQIKTRVLTKAANLNNEIQLTELCEWMLNL